MAVKATKVICGKQDYYAGCWQKLLSSFLSGFLIFVFFFSNVKVLFAGSGQTDIERGMRRVPEVQASQSENSIPDFGPDGLKGLTEDQKRKLNSGQVVMTSSPEITPDGKTMIAAVMKIEAPLDWVWAVLSATEKQIDYLEEIEELKLLEQSQNFNRMEFVVKVMGKRVKYTVVHHFRPSEYYFWWELDKKAQPDLKELSGFWKLYPADGNWTIARYGSRVVPDFPVPEFIRNWLYKKSVRSSLEKVRNYVEEKAGNS
ncbi:MAG: SRPBCC family protein [Acidobacteriota bacterium]|nr:SRPBCC family protein [Acidobacteriota bacterium]